MKECVGTSDEVNLEEVLEDEGKEAIGAEEIFDNLKKKIPNCMSSGLSILSSNITQISRAWQRTKKNS